MPALHRCCAGEFHFYQPTVRWKIVGSQNYADGIFVEPLLQGMSSIAEFDPVARSQIDHLLPLLPPLPFRWNRVLSPLSSPPREQIRSGPSVMEMHCFPSLAFAP